MTPIALDTNAYSAMRHGDPEISEVFRQADRLLLSAIVVGELISGFDMGTRSAANREALSKFLALRRVTLVPVTLATAEIYAKVLIGLRSKGRPIPSNDQWVAASALEHGASVLTLDAHFAAVEGLRVGRRLADFLP